jgi:D-psicose/D-tagatose/L-ribulose 3-epimerase
MSGFRFRHAMCNEAFESRPFHATCKSLCRIGYTGIEIAPFTLAEDPADLSPVQRREYRRIIEGSGLAFVGLHWLLASPPGLHVSTPDRALRERSWRHVLHLLDLCADLGPNGVLVFGSPKQRAAIGGLSREEATRNFVEGLAAAAPLAHERGVTLLLEALPLNQSNVVTTLEEAVSIVREIAHPGLATMFDTHNAVDESKPHAVLVDRYFEFLRHVHVNEMDGRHPGAGDYDFKPVLDTLRRREYSGWVSLEAFDFAPGAGEIASASLRFLEREMELLNA